MINYHRKNNMFIQDVSLVVKDIDKMLDFYLNTLGFRLLKQEDDVYYLGTSKQVLIKLISNPNASLRKRTTGLYHFAILLPNRASLGQILYHFLTNSIQITGASDHGVSEALYLDDPEGNGIEIYRDLPREDWPSLDGGISMYTEMMDASSVLDSRLLEEFTELPEDTIMGHIHLHVSDLDKARSFFIEKLSFQKILDYGGAALFISDAGYHHHIGLNVWRGQNIANKASDAIGLAGYSINLPKDKLEILENVDHTKIDENTYQVIDINDSVITFTVN